MFKPLISCAAATILTLGTAIGASHAAYPERPVSLVVTSTPGSPLDILGRLLAAEAGKELGQTVIVENRPGASGNVGGSYVARSAPDGHTVMLTLDNQVTVNPLVITNTQFNPATDLEPVARIGAFSQVLIAPKSLGVSNLKEFVELARSRDLTYATAGIGSPGHLTMAAFALAADLPMTHVPYKGNPPAVNDLLAGVVDTGFLVVSGVLPHIQSGAFVPLAVSGDTRNTLLPDVPTVAESGIPGTANFNSTFGYLVAMPKGTPTELIDRWNALLHDILRRPETQERLKMMDTEPVFASPAETREFLESETKRWQEVVEKANIRMN
ncbi:MAG: tripartite tricarboxylate transporter substrate binding protein [Pigmentiphaga sp.]|nr:tripartite tricarboxylate transporter substrate binding protein [Pigmentiphaga sp.]